MMLMVSRLVNTAQSVCIRSLVAVVPKWHVIVCTDHLMETGSAHPSDLHIARPRVAGLPQVGKLSTLIAE